MTAFEGDYPSGLIYYLGLNKFKEHHLFESFVRIYIIFRNVLLGYSQCQNTFFFLICGYELHTRNHACGNRIYVINIVLPTNAFSCVS
jgi:hypothetical protein